MTELKKTARGFSYTNFKDIHGDTCNIQESSNIDPAIWFGYEKASVKGFFPNSDVSWKDITPTDVAKHNGITCTTIVTNNRMQLTPKTVQGLIPTLQYFADNGVLPQEEKPQLAKITLESLQEDLRGINEELFDKLEEITEFIKNT